MNPNLDSTTLVTAMLWLLALALPLAMLLWMAAQFVAIRALGRRVAALESAWAPPAAPATTPLPLDPPAGPTDDPRTAPAPADPADAAHAAADAADAAEGHA